MAINRVQNVGRYIWLDAGASKSSGDLVVVNNLVGIAQQDSDSDDKCTIDRWGVYDLSVKGHDGSSNSAVAIGQCLYGNNTQAYLDKDTSKTFVGIALEIVTTGSTTTIKVDISPAYVQAVSNDSITSARLDPQAMKVATAALSSGLQNAYAFAWQNPEDAKILVHKVILDLTAAGGTATSIMDVGSAADATTNGDDLLDGVDINTTNVYTNVDEDDAGTNGVGVVKLDEKTGTTDYITGQILTADASSLAGYVYIYYTEVQ